MVPYFEPARCREFSLLGPGFTLHPKIPTRTSALTRTQWYNSHSRTEYEYEEQPEQADAPKGSVGAVAGGDVPPRPR